MLGPSRRSLEFTPDGSRLLIHSRDGLHVVDVTGRRPPLLIAGDIRAFAGIDDEIWIVKDGVEPTLHRLDATGAERGAPKTLWGKAGEGSLVRIAAAGSAWWTASPPGVITAAGSTRLPTDGHVIPVSATRWLQCGPDTLALREPTALRWSTPALGRDARISDGAIVLGGRCAVLVASAPGSEQLQHLIIINLFSGAIQHRLTLVGIDAVRFAPTRGFALLLVARRRVVLVDIRFGRVIKDHLQNDDVVDLAIDDAAQGLALRSGDAQDDIGYIAMRDFLSAGERASSAAIPPLAEQVAVERAPEVRAPPPADVVRWYAAPSELATSNVLAPRPQPRVASTERSAAILDTYRDIVTALVGRAIAFSWDEGRLTFASEGPLPYLTEVSGLLGQIKRLAAEQVVAAQARFEEALAAVRGAEVIMPDGVPPLLAMAHELDLSVLARQLLLVVAAPALWGQLARLYGILANDDNRPLCDEYLVTQALEGFASSDSVARELDRSAPLVRHGVVRFGEGMRPFVSLTVEPVVLRMLRGDKSTDALSDVRPMTATVSFDDLLIPTATKQHIQRQLARSTDARVVVRGRVGSGRHTLLATLAAAGGRGLGVVDAAPHLRDLTVQVPALRATLERAHLVGLVPCIDGLENLSSDDEASRELIRDLVRRHPGPLAIRLPWNVTPPIDSGYISIDLPQLSAEQRLTVWRNALAAHDLFVRDTLELAARYRVGPGIVMRACAQVSAALADDRQQQPSADPSGRQEPAKPEPRDVALDLETTVRQHLEGRLSSIATPVANLATWSQVVLPADIQDSLLELIARIRHRRVVYEKWGYDRVINTARGVTALFQGGPGTGKTLVASAIASELGMDLYRVDLSRIVSKWIGETEQNLAKLFDAAEDGHAIVLFDEADSLFAKRTEVRTSTDRYANLAVNYLLQRLDSFEGIAILTTNFGTAIDAAFKRRMSFRLTFPFPDEDAREQLWKAHLPSALPIAGELDLADLARRYRMSGGYIRNAILRAAFLAAEEHVALTQDHLERAVRAEFREIGKLAEFGVLE